MYGRIGSLTVFKYQVKYQVKHQTKHALIGSKVTDIFQNKQIFTTNSYIVVLY